MRVLYAIILPFPSPTHIFLLLPHLPSISDSPSTPLLCHPPSPQFVSLSFTLPYVSPSLQRHSESILPYSSLPLAATHFPPTPMLLALSLHFQYMSHQSVLQTIRCGTRWEV